MRRASSLRRYRDDSDRLPSTPFYERNGDGVDVQLLACMPSSVMVQRKSGWTQCCHGCADVWMGVAVSEFEKLLENASVRRIFVNPPPDGDVVGASSATRHARRAIASSKYYQFSPLKWADMTLDTEQRTERFQIPLEKLRAYADRLGLARDYGVVSGHQDLANLSVATDRPIADPRFFVSDVYENQGLHSLRVERVAGESMTLASDGIFRFLATSSALYAKGDLFEKEDDRVLSKVAWLELKDDSMQLRLAAPMPASRLVGLREVDRRIRSIATIDDLRDRFDEVLSFVVDRLTYPEWGGFVPDTPSMWDRTRLFSRALVDALFERVLDRYSVEGIRPNVVYYEKLPALQEEDVVIFVGDLHSSLHALGTMLRSLRERGLVESDGTVRDHVRVVFLGDLVDSGPFSVECLVLAMALKWFNWDSVHVVNGNHEGYEVYNRDTDTLAVEIEHEYGDADPEHGREPKSTAARARDTARDWLMATVRRMLPDLTTVAPPRSATP